MESLKLRIEVLTIVAAISVSVQADAVIVVFVQVSHGNRVPSKLDVLCSEVDPLIFENLAASQVLVVHDAVSHCDCAEVDVKTTVYIRGQFSQVEIYRRFSKVVLASVQSQLEIILDFLNHSFTSLRLCKLQCNIPIVTFIESVKVSKMLDNQTPFFIAGSVSFS